MTCDRCTTLDELVATFDALGDGPALIHAQRLQQEHVYLHRLRRKVERQRAEADALESELAEREAALVTAMAESEYERRQRPAPSPDWMPLGSVETVLVQHALFKWWKDRGTWPDPFDLAHELARWLQCSYEVASRGISDALDEDNDEVQGLHTVVAERLGEATGPFGETDVFRIYTTERHWEHLERDYRLDQLVQERVRQMEANR